LRGHKHSVSSIQWCPARSNANEIVATSVNILVYQMASSKILIDVRSMEQRGFGIP
jgi:hypothetical protein